MAAGLPGSESDLCQPLLFRNAPCFLFPGPSHHAPSSGPRPFASLCVSRQTCLSLCKSVSARGCSYSDLGCQLLDVSVHPGTRISYSQEQGSSSRGVGHRCAKYLSSHLITRATRSAAQRPRRPGLTLPPCGRADSSHRSRPGFRQPRPHCGYIEKVRTSSSQTSVFMSAIWQDFWASRSLSATPGILT